MQAKALRDALRHHAQELGLDVLGGVGRNDIAIAAALLAHERHLAPVDAMRVHDDLRSSGLAEDFRERDGGHAARGDNIGQHGPRPDRGELIDIAY